MQNKHEERSYPDFYHIGCLKTGTTSLQEVLGQDPRIHLILHKRFFNTNNYFHKTYNHCVVGKVNIESDENICLDYDSFSGLTQSLKRIKRHAPSAHIICTIREQRSLLVSAYKHHVVKSWNPSRSLEEFLHSPQGVAYLKIVDYHSVFGTIEQFFDRDHIHFFLVEDLKADYRKHYEKIYRVLGLSAPDRLVNTQKNTSPSDAYVNFCANLQSKLLFNENRILSKFEMKAQKYLRNSVKDRLMNDIQFSPQIAWGTGKLFLALEEEFRISNRLLCQQYGIDLKGKNYLL